MNEDKRLEERAGANKGIRKLALHTRPLQKLLKEIEAWQVLIICLALFCLLLLLFHGKEADRKPKRNRPSQGMLAAKELFLEIDTEAQKSSRLYKIGDEITYKKAKYKLERVERDATSADGKEYLIVYLTISNEGDKILRANPRDFRIKTSDGEILVYEILASGYEGEKFGPVILAPNSSFTAYIVFEVPKEDQRLKLVFSTSAIYTRSEFEIELR